MTDATNSLNTTLNNFQSNANDQFDGQSQKIDDSFQDLNDLMTRIWIERQLLVEQGNSNSLVSFVVPEAVGGLLEFVQFIVYDTIEMFQAVGKQIKNHVLKDLSEADALLAEADFKGAYDLFGKVYRQVNN